MLWPLAHFLQAQRHGPLAEVHRHCGAKLGRQQWSHRSKVQACSTASDWPANRLPHFWRTVWPGTEFLVQFSSFCALSISTHCLLASEVLDEKLVMIIDNLLYLMSHFSLASRFSLCLWPITIWLWCTLARVELILISLLSFLDL